MSSVRFACPACGATHSMPPGSEGRKGACARCHQRLLIPGEPKPVARTVLARELPPREAPSLLPPTTLHAPEQSAAPPRERRSFRLTVVGSLCAIALVALMAACAGVVVSLMPKKVADVIAPQAGQKAEKREKPRGAEEELVATWVRRNVGKEVKFLKWGPHLRREEVEALLREGGLGKQIDKLAERDADELWGCDVVVRVVFRTKGKASEFCSENLGEDVGDGVLECDWLVKVKDKLVLAAVVRNEQGDLFGPRSLVNEDGDEWKKRWREKMAKILPGIKGD